MSPQYAELRPTSSWGTVSWLDSVTARHLVVGVSQTLRRLTEGSTYIQQGDHHVDIGPHF